MQYPHPVQGTSAADVNQQHYHQLQTPLQHFQSQQQAAQYFQQPQGTPQQQHYQQQQQHTYQQQQFPQQQVVEGSSPGTHRMEEATDAPATPGLKGTLQNLSLRFTSPSANTEDKPNVGFTPTPTPATCHEEARTGNEIGAIPSYVSVSGDKTAHVADRICSTAPSEPR
jgi:hypothetical protein